MTMTVKEFSKSVNTIADEVCCDGGIGIASHKIPSTVSIWMDGEDDDNAEYELTEVIPSMLPGCGCWDGILLRVKRTICKETTHVC